MIKLNLLPPYVLEKRRIIMWIWIFLVLIGAESGILFKVYLDYKAQEDWFRSDKSYYEQRKSTIDKAKSDADAISTKVSPYTGYNDFFTRGQTVQYVQELAKAMAEPTTVLSSSPDLWYDNLTIDGKGVSTTGTIRGLMNFVNYYFKLKDAGYTVEPRAKPFPAPMTTQKVPLVVTGMNKTELPKPPAPPAAVKWGDLYLEAGKAAAPAEGGAAAGGAPG
ncbi:MAG: hypothetical protein ACYC7E_09945, partial [Armatimonadota bacterium]